MSAAQLMGVNSQGEALLPVPVSSFSVLELGSPHGIGAAATLKARHTD